MGSNGLCTASQVPTLLKASQTATALVPQPVAPQQLCKEAAFCVSQQVGQREVRR